MALTLEVLHSILGDLLDEGVDPDAPVSLIVGQTNLTFDADMVWSRPQRDRIYIQDEGPGFGNKED